MLYLYICATSQGIALPQISGLRKIHFITAQNNRSSWELDLELKNTLKHQNMGMDHCERCKKITTINDLSVIFGKTSRCQVNNEIHLHQ